MHDSGRTDNWSDRGQYASEEIPAGFRRCEGCGQYDDKDDMHHCTDFCDLYTCQGCFNDSERHGTKHCAACGNAPVPPDLT